MIAAQLAAVGIGELSIGPMTARPDTPARLACEDRGMPAILAACADPVARLDGIIAAAYADRAIDHYALSN